MYRYDLARPVEADGKFVGTVFLRRPTRADQTAIVEAVERQAARLGRALSAPERSAIMIERIAELPRDAVGKLKIEDAKALTVRITSMFASEGMV